jgi:hypothetical protein
VFGRDSLEKKLREHGKRASAEVLEAEQSGVGITEGNPAFAGATEVVWKLKLEVRPEGEQPFPAEIEARFPQYGGPRKGLVLGVLYDPGDHSKVVVDQSPEGLVETAMGTAFANNPALAASPMGGSIENLMREAMADPAGFAQKMQAQSAPWVAAMGTPGAASSGDATIDALEKLTALRDRGVLTPEEFEAQKKRILGET